ncbi:MAG: hypothetical protein WBC78_23115 [Candidatus Sulfotelmatobacter sp.]
MKFCKVSVFFALLVAVCLPVVGQTAMRVDIPFNFVAAGKSLPAGHYRVARLPISDCAWYISNDAIGAQMLTHLAESNQNSHRPSLVFLRAGGTYSLIKVRTDNSGWEVPQSKVKQTLVSKDGSKAGDYIEIGAE